MTRIEEKLCGITQGCTDDEICINRKYYYLSNNCRSCAAFSRSSESALDVLNKTTLITGIASQGYDLKNKIHNERMNRKIPPKCRKLKNTIYFPADFFPPKTVC